MVTRRELFGLLGLAALAPRGAVAKDATVTATLTGDLVTDALRGAGAEGDGRSSDSSVGLYSARTNLLANGGFEVDTRYWGGIFASVGRTTARAKFGQYAGRFTVTADGQNVIVSQSAAVTGTVPVDWFSWRLWLWAEGNVVGKTVKHYFVEGGGASGQTVPGQVNTVLAAGWNELRVSALVGHSDRTTLSCAFSIDGLATGDHFDIDGCQCVRGVSMPYVEASEALVPYAPTVNLAPNPSFESALSPWFAGTNSAIAQDTAHVHDGTYAMKLSATGSGNMSALRSSFFTGAPLAQVAYAVSRWCWAEGNAVGKLCHIGLNETGGAQATATMTFSSQSLVAGWNYFLVSATPAQADRTGIQVIHQVDGVSAGDAVWIDDQQAGDNYVAPARVTVSRSAGRVRLPARGLSPRQGWIALSVRPAWSTLASPQIVRPALPVTLWRWADDANNGLWLTFDGGLLTMTRVAGGVAQSASAPWAPERGSASVVVGAWDADGVYAGAEGRALVGPTQTIASDDFERADTASGLGTTPVGGIPWYTTGGSAPRIQSGRYEPGSVSGVGYGYLDLPEIPFQVGGTVSYTSADNLTTTIAWATANGNITNLLHMFMNRSSANYQYDTAFTNYRAATLATPCKTDGTPADVTLTLQGDTLAVAFNGENYAFRHESAARLATSIVFFETQRAASGGVSRWERVFANRATAWTPGGGSVPTLSTTTLDVGSKGDGTGVIDGDVLWAASGRGRLMDDDLAVLAAASGDVRRGDLSSRARTRFVWPAAGSALAVYDAMDAGYLGDGGIGGE